MAMLDLGSEGGKRVRVGLQLGVIRAELVKKLFKLSLGALVCQVRVDMCLVDIKPS